MKLRTALGHSFPHSSIYHLLALPSRPAQLTHLNLAGGRVDNDFAVWNRLEGRLVSTRKSTYGERTSVAYLS